jgi:hypothetical protein
MRYPNPTERYMREKHPGAQNGRGGKNTDFLSLSRSGDFGKKMEK